MMMNDHSSLSRGSISTGRGARKERLTHCFIHVDAVVQETKLELDAHSVLAVHFAVGRGEVQSLSLGQEVELVHGKLDYGSSPLGNHD